jgi:Zn-dependent peptidase ImmA (M78 family)
MPEREPKDSFLEVFLSGIDVSTRLETASPGFPRNVEAFIDLVENTLSAGEGNFRIYFHPRNYMSYTFIGTIEAYEHEAHIVYDRNRSMCWRRFIVVKEMCHLLFASHGQKHLASTPEQIGQLVTKILAGLENVDISRDHISSTETCTVFMALEVLMPHSEREKVNRMMQEGGSVLDVATYYRVPSQMVGLYLNEEYVRMMKEAYKCAGRLS